MKNQVDQELIPSFSFGYTAGAKYRLNGVFGSLTLGGFDAARFVTNNLTFPFAADDSRSLTIGFQSVIASKTLQGVLKPLTNGAFFLIDSSVSDLWLPIAACQLFEQAFGLTYDNTTNLYIVNASIHSQLQQLDPSVTFKIGISDFEGATVDINLPYGAFDLQASSPFYPDAMSYFPIRRAANSTQYILGRTFLQEAYLVVDYERSNFSVSQALFLNPCPQQLVAIHSVNHTSSNKTILTSIPTSHSTSRGVIAGAVVGAVLVIPLVIALAMFIRHYRGHRFRRPRATQRNTSELDAPGNGDEAKEDRVITPWILGIGGEEIPRNLQELGGRPWFRDQLEGTAVTAEMDHNLSEETNGSSSDHTPISPLREVRTGECTWATKGPHLNTLISPTNPCESTRNILHSRPSPLSPSSNGESTWRSFLSYQRPSLEIG